jgi:hypothetical protein
MKILITNTKTNISKVIETYNYSRQEIDKIISFYKKIKHYIIEYL